MKRFFSTILVLAAFAPAAQAVEAPLFTDTAGYPYQNAIAYVKQREIVTGYPDGSFRPETSVNRAEFVKMLVGAQYGSDLDVSMGGGLFTDVSADQWFAPYVYVAKEKGLIDGYADGTFKPGQDIAFVEAAKILSLAFGVKDPLEPDPNPWYRPYVKALEFAQAIPPDIATFDQPLTRGELAEMLWRLGMSETGQSSLTYADIDSWSVRTAYRDQASRVFVDYPSVWDKPTIPPREPGYPDLWLGGMCEGCMNGMNAFNLYVKVYESTPLTNFEIDGVWAREEKRTDGARVVVLDLPQEGCGNRSALVFLGGKVIEVNGVCLGGDLRLWNMARRIIETLKLNK